MQFRITDHENNQCEEELKGSLFDPLAVAIFSSRKIGTFGYKVMKNLGTILFLL